MSSNKAELLMMKGMLSEFPAERQQKVKDLIKELTQTIQDGGDDGLIALSFVALEIAIEEESK